MKVEIWSDFVCPFCYIGKRRFEAALEQFPGKNDVEVVYRSFELDPNVKKGESQDVHEMLASKYGTTREQAKAMTDNVTAQAESVGLAYHFDGMVHTNTFDAHRLAHFAAQQGKGAVVVERLLKAYFTESKPIGDHSTLTALAAEAGLDEKESAAVLAGGAFSEEVRSDEQDGANLGIRGVPFFVINRKYGVSGAQPSEVFLEALQRAWEDEHPITLLNTASDNTTDGGVCADGVCAPNQGGSK